MSETKHTPGPRIGWFRDQDSATAPPACGRVIWPPWSDTKESSGYSNKADVRLIAAAPDLLEALKNLASSPASFSDERLDYEERQVDKNDLKAALAAIAKAEGR